MRPLMAAGLDLDDPDPVIFRKKDKTGFDQNV
jgi:hypothetical protein